jgi:hypothetical protein
MSPLYIFQKRRKGMKKELLVFVSQPMHGKRESLLMANIRDVSVTLQKMLPEFDIKMIDNVHHKDVGLDAHRLEHLGESIKQMAKADLVVFAGNWLGSSGCSIERSICIHYDIPVVFSEDTSDIWNPRLNNQLLCDEMVFNRIRKQKGVTKVKPKSKLDKDSMTSRILGR